MAELEHVPAADPDDEPAMTRLDMDSSVSDPRPAKLGAAQEQVS